MALRICSKSCCRNGCLKLLNEEDAVEIVMGCIDEVRGLTRRQKHEHIFQKLLNSAVGVSEGGYLDCPYNLGVGINRKAYNVCHQCFQNVYDVGSTQLYEIRSEVKRRWLTSDPDENKSGGSSRDSETLKNNPKFIKALCSLAASRGYSLDRYEMAGLVIPNSASSLACFAWLDDHFDLVCESEPNSCHMTMEPVPLQEIYDEYCIDAGLCHENCVSLTSFRRIWKGCFPHVQRRPYIDCNLKCMTCAALAEARLTHKSKN